jgi:hypothetical protein
LKNITFILLTVLLIGCYNDNGINVSRPDYIPGELVFMLKDSVSLEEFADYIYSINYISIESISALQYTSTLPADSVEIINSVIKSRAYIYSEFLSTRYLSSEKKILIEIWLKSFNSENLSDWKSISARFGLLHRPNHSQIGTLNVPAGQEKIWINYLSQTNLFNSLEQNAAAYPLD